MLFIYVMNNIYVIEKFYGFHLYCIIIFTLFHGLLA